MATLRGTSLTAVGATSVTITISPLTPAGGGSVTPSVGDRAYILVGSAYVASVFPPAGWASVYAPPASIWETYIATKVLTSGDIAAGNVTVNITGNYDVVGMCFAMVGDPSLRETDNNVVSGSSTINTTSAVQTGDTGIYLFNSRNSGAASGLTPGAGSATQLQTVGGSDCRGTLWLQTMPGGVQANVYTGYTGNGTIWQFIFYGSGVTGALIGTNMDGMGFLGQLKGGLNA